MGVARRFGVIAAVAAFTVAAAASAGAQVTTGTITGRIVDSTSQEPLPGVTVRIVGTQLGTQSRADGAYTLVGIPSGPQTVQVNRIGYAAQRQQVNITLGGTITVPFFMRAVAATLTDVVVVGYGTQRREAVTAAITSINADEAKVGVQPNVNDLIQGRAAGVQITQNSGDPGAGAQIRIRGGSSISASNEPLYVIDGVPIQNERNQVGGLSSDGNAAQLARSPLNTLNPADIAEISILKDASATAIYGSRGANGVVLITTRKGAAGQSTVDYDGYVGFASAANQLDVLTGDEYRGYIQSQVNLYVQDSVAGKAAADRRGYPSSRLQALGSANTNWQDATQRTARIQSHNLGFSGGSQATTYRASLNYFDNPGVTLGSGMTRYQGRLNGQTRALDDRLSFNLNLTASQVHDRYLLAETRGGFTGGVFINAVQFNPTEPIMASSPAVGATPYYEIGPGAQNDRNPVALTQQLNDRGITNRILSNLLTSYTVLPNLVASVNVGVDRSTGERGTYYPNISPLGAGKQGQARQASRNLQGATVQTLLTYDQPFETSFLGKQSINAVAGYEYQRSSVEEFGAERDNFVTDANGFYNLAGGSVAVVPFSSLEIKKQLGLFGRLNYGLRDRYFVTATARRDGASMFGANHKYAFFPGVSGSWRLSEEDFMKGRMFDDLKLRAGYGKQGNQAIGAYRSLATLGTDPNARYPFGGTLITGVLPNQNANPDLKWETTSQSDAAVDFAVMHSRLTGTLEYYSKNTSDLLLEIAVPQPAVVATQLQNIGKVKNAGLEATLDYLLLNQPGRTVSVGFVATGNRNKVVSLGGQQQIFTGIGSGQGQSATRAELIVPGEPLGTFVGPVYAGADPATGRQLFNDYDASGKVVGTVTFDKLSDADKLRRLGNANPKAELAFRSQVTLGRFGGSFLVRGQTGNKVFNNTAAVYATKANANNNHNFLRSALTDGLGTSESNFFSSRFVEDGSFIRLQNVTLTYSLPLRLVRIPRATGASIYVSGDNLLLGTHYSGLDPEVFSDASDNGIPARGIDYLSYPRARTFTTGVRLGF